MNDWDWLTEWLTCAYRVADVCLQSGGHVPTEWRTCAYRVADVCLQSGWCVPTDSLSIYKWKLLCSWNWNSTKIEVCQNVILYHWAGSFWCFIGLSSLQNVRNFSPNSALSHPRRRDFSAALLCEPQISWRSSIYVTHIHSKVFFFVSYTVCYGCK